MEDTAAVGVMVPLSLIFGSCAEYPQGLSLAVSPHVFSSYPIYPSGFSIQ